MHKNEVFLARQPIFDRGFAVYAYEILARSGPDNVYRHADADQASTEVIAASLDLYTLRTLAGTKRVFINLTRELVTSDLVRVLPPESTVLELLESVAGDPEVLAACRELKRAGFKIALDDFDGRPELAPLVELADILKIDFLSTSAEARRSMLERYARPDLTLLAEKVETRERVQEALALGFSLFQGYFFCAPELLQRRALPKVKANYVRLLAEFSGPDVALERVEDVLRAEPSLSIKLLRYLNSAAFSLRNQIGSLRHGLVYLGERPLRRWVALALVSGLGEDKPPELIITTLVRARFCEQLAALAGHVAAAPTWFLAGLLSTLDALTDRPMSVALSESATCPEIVSALLGDTTPLGHAIRLVLDYERGRFGPAAEAARSLGVPEDGLPACYQHSVLWAQALFGPQDEEQAA